MSEVDIAIAWGENNSPYDCESGLEIGYLRVLGAEVRRLRAELASNDDWHERYLRLQGDNADLERALTEVTAPGWRDYYAEMKNLKERLALAEKVVECAEGNLPASEQYYDHLDEKVARAIKAYREEM